MPSTALVQDKCASKTPVPPGTEPTHPGRALRQAREQARMSRADLARLAGLSEGTIKNVETGKPVSTATLRALMTVQELGLAPDFWSQFDATAEDAHGVSPNAWYA